jgi:signal transduction histidine kinase
MLAAVVVSGGYLLIGIGYILLSSRLAAALAGSVTELKTVEELKGIAFVAITGLGLFALTYHGLRRIERHQRDADTHLEALAAAENRALVGMLASSLAHDIRNALSVTSSELELRLESDALTSEERAALEAARAANDRVVELTHRLSQLGRERMAGEPDEAFDLARLLRDLERVCRHHRAIRHHLSATTGLDQPCPMTGSPLLLARAVTNLMVNAGEAMATPGRLHLELVRMDPGVVELWMDDSGPGIPVADREQVFAAFHTSKPEGTGIGLLSVRLCAEHHGGAAWVEDSPLGGARFVMRLRLTPPQVT